MRKPIKLLIWGIKYGTPEQSAAAAKKLQQLVPPMPPVTINLGEKQGKSSTAPDVRGIAKQIATNAAKHNRKLAAKLAGIYAACEPIIINIKFSKRHE